MASLDGVRKVRQTLRGGVELQYKDFTACLGDFRPPEALAWMSSPGWLRVSSASVSRQSIEFYRNKDEHTDGLRRMEGCIIVWFCQSDTLVRINGLDRSLLIDEAM
jgi:hypothetical protein